jgi:hypothetical protein
MAKAGSINAVVETRLETNDAQTKAVAVAGSAAEAPWRGAQAGEACAQGEQQAQQALEERGDIRRGPPLSNGLRFAILPLPDARGGPANSTEPDGRDHGVASYGAGAGCPRTPSCGTASPHAGDDDAACLVIILKLYVGALDEEPLQSSWARQLAALYARRWREREQGKLARELAGTWCGVSLAARAGLRSLSLRLGVAECAGPAPIAGAGSGAKGAGRGGLELGRLLESLRDVVFPVGSAAANEVEEEDAGGGGEEEEEEDEKEKEGEEDVEGEEGGCHDAQWLGRRHSSLARLLHRETLIPAR